MLTLSHDPYWWPVYLFTWRLSDAGHCWRGERAARVRKHTSSSSQKPVVL